MFGFSLASGAALDGLRARLAEANIVLAMGKAATQTSLQINETINRRAPEEIARVFVRALG